ncbi:MAG TPA: O-antigen ligase family protein [Bryobacteraceae bacterium]|jgi:hypothetical protein
MSFIVIFASVVSFIWMARKSYREAFVDVYVAVLLTLPGWCRWPIAGLPDPTFAEAALLPVAAVFVFRGFKGYRFSFMDILVAALLTVIGTSEYQNAGFNDAQNLIFDMLASGLLPYLLAKSIIFPSGLQDRFLRNFINSLSLVIITCLWEARMGVNLYSKFFVPLFNGQGEGWVITFRYGLARVAGPFGHAILAGLVFMFGFRLQTWLAATTKWDRRVLGKELQAGTKAKLLTWWTLLGLALTWVRGPQIGTFIAWVFSLMGRGAQPRKRARIMFATILLVGIPIVIQAYNYAAVGRAAAKSDSQETAAYRKELIDKYIDIAVQHVWLGWGRNGWPKVPGMPSIDNYYLLLLLMHGLPAVILLALILIVTSVRLYRNGMKFAPVSPPGASLSFNLFGLFVGFAFSIFTVFMGDSIIPLFFMMVGFSEGFLQAGGDALMTQARTVIQAAKEPQLAFRRVVS